MHNRIIRFVAVAVLVLLAILLVSLVFAPRSDAATEDLAGQTGEEFPGELSPIDTPPLTLVYLYKKANPEGAPGWGNIATGSAQTLIYLETGHSLTPAFPVPSDICGPQEWAVQIDLVEGLPRAEVPTNIYPHGLPVKPVKAIHHTLDYFVTVPLCDDDTPDEVTPIEPQVTESVTPTPPEPSEEPVVVPETPDLVEVITTPKSDPTVTVHPDVDGYRVLDSDTIIVELG